MCIRDRLNEERLQELERISGLTSEQAKEYLLKTVEEDVKLDTAKLIKEMENKAKEEADKKAKDYVVTAIQKCAADHVAETTISVVQLPNDEMKGRIIGREGRNIRTLETMTGVDLIIDDTPEAVILSGFDPIRREVARIALEKLIVDGRIHPARIEEMVEKAQKEVETMIREEGEAATLEVGVHGIHPELVRLLGRMKFRSSYGQNALKHSIEVAHLDVYKRQGRCRLYYDCQRNLCTGDSDTAVWLRTGWTSFCKTHGSERNRQWYRLRYLESGDRWQDQYQLQYQGCS